MVKLESDYVKYVKFRPKKLVVLKYRLACPYRCNVAHKVRVKAFHDRNKQHRAKGYSRYRDRRGEAWWYRWSDVDLFGKWSFKVRREL